VGFSHVESARAVADFAASIGYQAAGTISAGDERAQRRKLAFAEKFARLSGAPVEQVDFSGQASIEFGRRGLAGIVEGRSAKRMVIFCSSDILAHGAIIEAHARGLAIPNEVALIGFGDQDFAAHIEPGITTVRVDRGALGLAAANAILGSLSGNAPPGQIIDLGFEIVRRGSA
jgi:LacI family transcriptional regulator, gluconate utilization system Gnt-I transcriptional repressor